MTWTKYFKVKGIKPGPVHVHGLGIINLDNPKLDINTIIKLYENDFPYLEITPEGLEEVYGVKNTTQQQTVESEQSTVDGERSTVNGEQRTTNKEPRTKNQEQRTKNKEQKTKNKKHV